MIRVAAPRAALVVAYMTLILTLTIAPGDQLSKLGIGRTLLDLGHVPLFAGFALVSFWALAAPLAWRALATLIFCVAFAAIGEWSQAFIPRRFPTVGDFGADCIGIGIGIGVALVAWLVSIIPALAQPRGGASR